MGRGVRRELQLGFVNQMLTKLAREVARNMRIVVAHWNETSDDNPWSIRVESGCNIATIMKCQSIVENQRNGQSNRPVDVEFVKSIVTHAVNGRETSVWKMRRSMLDNQEWANEDYSVIFFRLVRVSAYADALISGTDTGQQQPFCAVKLMVEHAKQLGYVIAHKSEPFVDQMAEGPNSILRQILPSVFDGLDGSETCFGARRKEPKQRGPNGQAFGSRSRVLTEDEKNKKIKELTDTINSNNKKCYPVYVTRDASESGENRYCLAMSMMAIDQQVLLEVRGVQLREERVGSGGGVVLYRPLESMRRLMYEVSSKRHVLLDKVDKWKEAYKRLLEYIETLKKNGYDEIKSAVDMCYCANATVTTMKIAKLQEHLNLVSRLMQLQNSNALLVGATKGEDNLIEAMDGALKEVEEVYEEYIKEVGMKEKWSHAADGTENAKTAYKSKRTEYINGLKLYVTEASNECALFLALQTAMINHHNVSEALFKFEKETQEAKTRVTDAEKALEEAKRILALSLAEKGKADAALNGGQPQDVEAQVKAEAINAKHNVLLNDEKAAQKRQEEAQAALDAATANTTQTNGQKRDAENAVTAATKARSTVKKTTALNVDLVAELDAYKNALHGIQLYLEGRTKAVDKNIANTHSRNSQKSEYVLQTKEEKARVLGEAFRIKVTQRDPVFFAVQVSGELFRLVDAATTRPDNFRNKKGRKGIEGVADAKAKVTAEEEDYKKCVQTASAYFELYIGRKNTDLWSPYRWDLGPASTTAAAFGSGSGSALTKPDVTRLVIVPYGLGTTSGRSATALPLFDMTVFLHRSGIYMKNEGGSIACAWCGHNVTESATAKTKKELEEVYAPRAQCAASDESLIGGLASLCNVGKCKHDAAAKGAV